MNNQLFRGEIIRECIPGCSYIISFDDPLDNKSQYESLHVLKDHYMLSDPFRIGDAVMFKGKVIELLDKGGRVNLIVAQSPLRIIKDRITTLKCIIDDIIIDHDSGQLFTARLKANEGEKGSDYINLVSSSITMPGIKKGLTILAKGHFIQAALHRTTKRKTTIPVFVVERHEVIS